MPRRHVVQGSLTAAVLAAGVAATAIGAAATSPAVAAPAPRLPHVAASAPVETPAAQLRHGAHESWSRLLAAPHHRWTTTHRAAALPIWTLSTEFAVPAKVRGILQADGYRRGVTRVTRAAHHGVVEQLWHFRAPAGAKAWFLTYATANRPHAGSTFGALHLVGDHGDLALTTSRRDAAGYHYGVGVALDGDMIVHVRVFGSRGVGTADVARELRRAEWPVARGITLPGLGPVTNQTVVSPTLAA